MPRPLLKYAALQGRQDMLSVKCCMDGTQIYLAALPSLRKAVTFRSD